jgi:hypothetical protein
MLLKNYIDFITPMRERRKYYQDNPAVVIDLLQKSAQQIQRKIKPLMIDIRTRVGIL